MKKHYLIYIFLIISFSCQQKAESNHPTSDEKIGLTMQQSESDKFNYKSFGKSSFTILKDSTRTGPNYYSRKYVKVEPSYDVFRIYHPDSVIKMTYHIAEIVKTIEMTVGSQGGKSEIIAIIKPFDNPDSIDFTLNEKCDEIIFDPDFYRIIENGCCSFEGWIKLYDYEHNLIAEGKPEMINEKFPKW